MKIGAKVIKKTNTNKLNYKIMKEIIIKSFSKVETSGENEYLTTYHLIKRRSVFAPLYRVKIYNHIFVKDKIAQYGEITKYYDDIDTAIKEMKKLTHNEI